MSSRFFRIDCLDQEISLRTTPDEMKRIVGLRENPNFLKGLAEYGRLIPEYFANKILLNKVVTEVWRFEMLVFSLYLYDTKNPEDPRSGLTMTNLQKLCAEQGIASPGRVMAIIGIMRLGGYLKLEKSVSDKRVVQLKPSDNFIKIVEGWNSRLCQIIDAILPEERLFEHHQMHPRFGWVMRRLGAEGMIKGWRLLTPFPEVNHFVQSDGGWMLLLNCVSHSLEIGEHKRILSYSLDLKAFGKSFGVSRSHLRRLLESGYSNGLLDEPPRNGTTIRLSEKLVASFLSCMASELSYYLAQARGAKTELGLQ